MLERFESKSPIKSCGVVDKNESTFVTSNQCTISKCNVCVDNVKVTGQWLIDCFASWSFGDSHVQAKRDQEFTGVDKVSNFRSIGDMAVVAETTTSCYLMKFFWHPRQFVLDLFGQLLGKIGGRVVPGWCNWPMISSLVMHSSHGQALDGLLVLLVELVLLAVLLTSLSEDKWVDSAS